MTSKRIAVSCVFLCIFFFILATSVLAAPIDKPNINFQVGEKDNHPKMESVLSELYKEHKKGKTAAESFAKARDLKIEAQDRVTVFLLLEKGKTMEDIDTGLLTQLGVDITKSHGNVIKAKVPLDTVESLADTASGINFIKFPDKLHAEAVVTEGLIDSASNNCHFVGVLSSSKS